MIRNTQLISIDEFDYRLPESSIAQHPMAQRDGCKLLVRGSDGSVSDHRFYELPGLLPRGAMLVYNNTRVINARLRFRKSYPDGAMIEVFCLEPVSPVDYAESFASTGSCEWLCFVGNVKKWKGGAISLPVTVGGRSFDLEASVEDVKGNARVIKFEWNCDDITFSEIIQAVGEIPIPPYLNRVTEQCDAEDYQTVYSHIEGSVAAPTAGLHFTPELLHAIDCKGICRRELTLHVGAGTFQPVKSDSIGEHDMHSEFISVERALIEELAHGGRDVIAVGTTSVRTLESLYHAGCMIASGCWHGEVPQWYPYEGSHPDLPTAEALSALLEFLDREGLSTFVAATRIIIAPGYRYRMVKGMVTNFHQPRSTLLLLVSAFMGDEWRSVYEHALDAGYRFLSYGDACLFL